MPDISILVFFRNKHFEIHIIYMGCEFEPYLMQIIFILWKSL